MSAIAHERWLAGSNCPDRIDRPTRVRAERACQHAQSHQRKAQGSNLYDLSAASASNGVPHQLGEPSTKSQPRDLNSQGPLGPTVLQTAPAAITGLRWAKSFSTPGEIRTHNIRLLSAAPLPVGLRALNVNLYCKKTTETGMTN
jgi:hypothetical protein